MAEFCSARLTEERLAPRSFLDDIPLWHPDNFHDTGQLLLFILSGEDGHTSVQLGENAS